MSVIAIAGATGTVGGKLARQLLEGGAQVRLLSRNPTTARSLFAQANAQVVGVDFDDVASLRRAFEGADSAFLCLGTSARQVRDEVALIDAAVQAQVPYLVNLSVAGAGADTPVGNNVLDWHTQIDAHLSSKNVAWTTLRPTTFIDALVRIASGFAPAGRWGGNAGNGAVSAIDTRDVADCAAAVLREGAARHAGKAYGLSGPSPFTMHDLAALLCEGRETPLAYVDRSAQAQRDVYAAAGLSPLYVDVLLGLDELTRGNTMARPLDGVMTLTGRAARSAAGFIREQKPR